MAYEEVTSLDCDTVYSLGNENNPRKVEGYYIGFKTVTTDTGPSRIHVFQTPKGNIGVWGSADTNAKLAGVNLGTMTLVEFKEKKKIGGGKTKKIFAVKVDKSNTIEVNTASEAQDTSASSYEDAETTDDSYDTSDDSPAVDASFEQQAVQRKANVQALLSKKSK